MEWGVTLLIFFVWFSVSCFCLYEYVFLYWWNFLPRCQEDLDYATDLGCFTFFLSIICLSFVYVFQCLYFIIKLWYSILFFFFPELLNWIIEFLSLVFISAWSLPNISFIEINFWILTCPHHFINPYVNILLDIARVFITMFSTLIDIFVHIF